MVRNYLTGMSFLWLVVHIALSWGVPGGFVGTTILLLTILTSLLLRSKPDLSCACYMPLTVLPIWGVINETVWSIFFRCFAEGYAHDLASVLVVLLSVSFVPSLFKITAVSGFSLRNPLFCLVWLLECILSIMLFRCAILVFFLHFMILLLCVANHRRGFVCAFLLESVLFFIDKPLCLSAHYLLVECCLPVNGYLLKVLICVSTVLVIVQEVKRTKRSC